MTVRGGFLPVRFRTADASKLTSPRGPLTTPCSYSVRQARLYRKQVFSDIKCILRVVLPEMRGWVRKGANPAGPKAWWDMSCLHDWELIA